MRGRDDLLQEIEAAEAQLERMAVDADRVEDRLARLRKELTCSIPGEPARLPTRPEPAPSTPKTPEEKVELFRRLFAGRVDVFPTRFVSKRI